MRLFARGDDRPPAGSPIHVQARDTTFEDAAAPVIAAVDCAVSDVADGPLAIAELSLESLPTSAIVWAHVDVDRDGRLSKGDFVTMQSYPIPGADRAELDIEVRGI